MAQVLQLKQKPHEGREYNKEKEDKQEHVSTRMECACLPGTPSSCWQETLTSSSAPVASHSAGQSLAPTAKHNQPTIPRKQGHSVQVANMCLSLVRLALQSEAVNRAHPVSTLCADTVQQSCLQDMTHPDEAAGLSTANGDYDSAFPNVGLIVWQAGFVLGE